MSDIFFVAGLPRSGSTLLMNVLGQNPRHYVSPSSGLVSMVSGVIKSWHQNPWFRAEGLATVKPRVLQMLAAMLGGYYFDELAAGQVVFDKNREWPFFLQNLEEAAGRPAKIILMIRDVRSIVASFERLYRGRGIEYQYPFMQEEAWQATHSVEGRCRLLLAPGGVVGSAVNLVRDAVRIYGEQRPARLIRVSYEAFTREPAKVLAQLHAALGLPEYRYDVEHVEQITTEDDMLHGLDLHTIRPRIEHRPRDWRCLPAAVLAELAAQYADLNAWDEA